MRDRAIGATRECADRFFRDIHGTESLQPTIVIDDARHDRRHAPGDDDVLWRHWAVVCADRGGPGPR
jgi:hypothetical protein